MDIRETMKLYLKLKTIVTINIVIYNSSTEYATSLGVHWIS